MKEKLNKYYPFLLFAIVFFTAQCFVAYYNGDDIYFLNESYKYENIFEFVTMRYNTWSGRIISEFFIIFVSKYLNIWIWKVINTVIAVFFIYIMTKIIECTYEEKLQDYKIRIIRWFVCLSFFIIPISVTTRGCLWYTGSFYYLWPMTAFFIYMYICILNIYERKIKNIYYFIGILCVIFSVYMEQIAAVIICFTLLSILFLFIATKKINYRLMFFLIIAIVNAGMSLTAPGNTLRTHKEILKWYPQFEQLSFMDKIIQGVNWTHCHMVRETTFIMFVISLSLFVLSILQKKNKILKVLSFVPLMFFIGSSIPVNKILLSSTSYEYNYDIEGMLGRVFFNPMQGRLPAIICSLIIVDMIIIIFFSFTDKKERFLCSTLFLAALCSGYMMGISPTIFASGPRVFFMSNMLFIIIEGILLKNILIRNDNNKIYNISIFIYGCMSAIGMTMYVVGIAMKTIFKIN